MSKVEKKSLWNEVEVAAIVNAAVASEREACAQIADDYVPGDENVERIICEPRKIAAAIRARGQK